MGILITSGNGISYFYGDGMQESQGNKDFVLTRNLLVLIEKKWVFSVYTVYVFKL